MSDEHKPTESPATESKPKRKRSRGTKAGTATSQAQIDANRRNALLSTGPITPTGKAVSSRNALKHGHCALVVPVPDEDPALFLDRFDAWSAELNPRGGMHGDYLVSIAVRKSIKLDRLNVVQTARAAKLARDAVKDRSIARAKGIEEAIRIMLVDPDIAVRRLRETPEGCDLLIKEWSYLKGPLLEPPQWDLGDAASAHCLMADFSVARVKAPGLLAIPTRWIEEHREVSRKLKENERPTWIDWTRRYMTKDEHEYDKERVDELREASKAGQIWVSELIEAQIKGLVELREGLLAEDAIDVEQASLRARVDTSDEGRLMHRYEMDAERGLMAVVAALRGRLTARTEGLQMELSEHVPPNPAAAGPAAEAPAATPPAPRNEANSAGRSHKPDLARMVEDRDDSFVDIAITPPIHRSNRE